MGKLWCCKKSKVEKVADTVKGKATEVAHQSINWAAPHVEQLHKRVEKQVIPAVLSKVDGMKGALSDASEAAKDSLREATKQAVHAADKTTKKGLETAHKHTNELAKKTQKLTKKELRKLQGKKKSHKGLVFLLLSSLVAGLGYVFWKRSQPVDDPWAEEYWEDIDLDNASDDTVENASDKLEEAADQTKDKAQEVKDTLQDKVEEAASKTSDKIDNIRDKVADKVDEVKNN